MSMVDVSAKKASSRRARAEARLTLTRTAAEAIRKATLKKGDALVAAQIAGILAAKQTAALIPLTHPLPLSRVDVSFRWDRNVLLVQTDVQTNAATGVEMEALVAAAIAALTIYDMAKSLERGIQIESIRLVEKTGGKSGAWKASQ